jgi:outer membrane phospholipase A
MLTFKRNPSAFRERVVTKIFISAALLVLSGVNVVFAQANYMGQPPINNWEVRPMLPDRNELGPTPAIMQDPGHDMIHQPKGGGIQGYFNTNQQQPVNPDTAPDFYQDLYPNSDIYKDKSSYQDNPTRYYQEQPVNPNNSSGYYQGQPVNQNNFSGYYQNQPVNQNNIPEYYRFIPSDLNAAPGYVPDRIRVYPDAEQVEWDITVVADTGPTEPPPQYTDNTLSSRFSIFGQNYVVYSKPDYTKLQLSFKYKLVSDFGLYFAYTQLMLWDLFGSSAPIINTDYKPQIFYRFQIPTEFLHSIDLGFFEHMSNGQSGLRSRSTESSYVRLNNWYDFRPVILGFDLKLYALYDLSTFNTDLRRYMGFWSIRPFIRNFLGSFLDKEELYLAITPGGGGGNFALGSQEVGLKFKLTAPEFGPSFYIQYFHGYAESLLNYNKKVSALRFGIVFE